MASDCVLDSCYHNRLCNHKTRGGGNQTMDQCSVTGFYAGVLVCYILFLYVFISTIYEQTAFKFEQDRTENTWNYDCSRCFVFPDICNA